MYKVTYRQNHVTKVVYFDSWWKVLKFQVRLALLLSGYVKTIEFATLKSDIEVERLEETLKKLKEKESKLNERLRANQ